jgi:hypothetical protein
MYRGSQDCGEAPPEEKGRRHDQNLTPEEPQLLPHTATRIFPPVDTPAGTLVGPVQSEQSSENLFILQIPCSLQASDRCGCVFVVYVSLSMLIGRLFG